MTLQVCKFCMNRNGGKVAFELRDDRRTNVECTGCGRKWIVSSRSDATIDDPLSLEGVQLDGWT